MSGSTSTTQPAVPRVRNRRGQGERLREQLIEAASELITETGDVGSVTLRAVAARAGIAAPSVYLHFADVDALKMAVANRSFADFNSARAAASLGIVSASESLIRGCQVYAEYAIDHPGHYRLMFGPGLPPLTGEQGTANRDAFDSLVNSITRCQTQGDSPDSIPPERLALVVWTALHGQATLRIDRPHMPWPPLKPMIAELTRRLVGLPEPQLS